MMSNSRPDGVGGPSSVAHRPLTSRVVIATHNAGKLAEMRGLLAPF